MAPHNLQDLPLSHKGTTTRPSPNTISEFSRYAQKALPNPKAEYINSTGDKPEDLLRFQAKARRRAGRTPHSAHAATSTQTPDALPSFKEIASFAGMGGMGVIANPGTDGSISPAELKAFKRRTKHSIRSRRNYRAHKERSQNIERASNRARGFWYEIV